MLEVYTVCVQPLIREGLSSVIGGRYLVPTACLSQWLAGSCQFVFRQRISATSLQLSDEITYHP